MRNGNDVIILLTLKQEVSLLAIKQQKNIQNATQEKYTKLLIASSFSLSFACLGSLHTEGNTPASLNPL